MTMEMFEITQREVAKNVNHSRWLFSEGYKKTTTAIE